MSKKSIFCKQTFICICNWWEVFRFDVVMLCCVMLVGCCNVSTALKKASGPGRSSGAWKGLAATRHWRLERPRGGGASRGGTLASRGGDERREAGWMDERGGRTLEGPWSLTAAQTARAIGGLSAEHILRSPSHKLVGEWWQYVLSRVLTRELLIMCQGKPIIPHQASFVVSTVGQWSCDDPQDILNPDLRKLVQFLSKMHFKPIGSSAVVQLQKLTPESFPRDSIQKSSSIWGWPRIESTGGFAGCQLLHNLSTQPHPSSHLGSFLYRPFSAGVFLCLVFLGIWLVRKVIRKLCFAQYLVYSLKR